MAENEQGAEKSEQPTAKRMSEARNEGNLAKSQDLNVALGLLAGMGLLALFGGSIFDRIVIWTQMIWREMATAQPDIEWFLAESPAWLAFLISLVAPFMGLLALLTILLTISQVGLLFTVKPFQPKFSKFLNPIPGLLKMFQRDSWVRLLMSLAKVAIVTAVAYVVISSELSAVASIGLYPLESIFSDVSAMSLDLGIKMALAMLILAIIDWRYQKFTHNEQLKMTKEEVREETKQMEGDPKVRQRRRKIQMELARERMMKSIESADVVVTNPIELAVALRYDPDLDAAPKVVAKGARLMAQRIKEIARMNEVPIYEHKPLARALFEAVEVNETIPERLYQGVATILAYVYESSNSHKRSQFTE